MTSRGESPWRALAPRTRTVDLFGPPADWDCLNEIAERCGLALENPEMPGHKGMPFDSARFTDYDDASICTDRNGVDYAAIVATCPLAIDTRNALRNVAPRDNIVLG